MATIVTVQMPDLTVGPSLRIEEGYDAQMLVAILDKNGYAVNLRGAN
jgi:hypothetical protein